MTTEAINDFAKAVQANEEMARGLVAAIGEKKDADAAEAFAAYAQGQGFAVTREDAEALQTAARTREEGTLSDDELDGVAGGFLASLGGTFLNAFAVGSYLGGKALGAGSKALDDLAWDLKRNSY